ncbi:PREDICTED: transport and Golgi organization 2 homolog [Fragaria vesca subsp. vesca]|uniref:transport and Golgi organization 2 homolog n=1 Tax=Fragaria vesca subsp. vesca TaxID=101020 RepID=UPI0002C3487C|nr:PREDICTED: transport and Golgi organization 2 homolog [Fragaria vesca subsp. vesca]
MCIAVFIWQDHPLYPLLLLANRDEYHNRPTKPVEWWEGCKILGGRDEVAGGTWLACSRGGRVALLTNVLEVQTLPEAKTRGDLPVLFLKSLKSPKEFAQELVKEAHQYNGFNLILADLQSKTMVYLSNRPKGEPILVQQVSPGIHVLSNAKLDSPWHKAQRLRLNFQKELIKYGEDEIPVRELIEKLMKDKVKADKSKLPCICKLDWEYKLSSIFVEVDTPLGRYGTRSSAAVSVRQNGNLSFHESYLENDKWKERTVNYKIEKLK